ncbi:MAG: hypothetical protein ABIE14_03600 [Patescibacteria group bacterium]
MSEKFESRALKLPILLASGTPMSEKLLERLIKFFRADGREVFCPKHSQSFHPAKNRPSDLAMAISQNNSKKFHLVAHSYGGIDALRLIIEREDIHDKIASLTLVNSPSGKKNNLLKHLYRFVKYVLPGILFIKSAEENKMLRRLARAAIARVLELIPETFDIVSLDSDKLFAAAMPAEIPTKWIQSPDDTFLYPDGVKSKRQPDIFLEEGGNHCGVLFDPEKYGGRTILNLISEIENLENPAD